MTTFFEKELEEFKEIISIFHIRGCEPSNKTTNDKCSESRKLVVTFLRSHDHRLIDMIMEIIKSEENIPNKLFVYRKNVWDVYKGRIGEKLQALKEQLK